jgi:hypothetical protein
MGRLLSQTGFGEMIEQPIVIHSSPCSHLGHLCGRGIDRPGGLCARDCDGNIAKWARGRYDGAALQMVWMALAGWLDSRERHAIAYPIEENRVVCGNGVELGRVWGLAGRLATLISAEDVY